MEPTVDEFEEKLTSWYSGLDSHVDKWFLMSSPLVVVFTIGSYLLLILYIGPNYMKDRKPLQLKYTMVLYNGLQVLFSVFLIYTALRAGIPFLELLSPLCKRKINETQDHQYLINSALWWYMFAKVTELLDTIFFVLRKKSSQVSFLHLYHHCLTFIIAWGFLKYIPEETGMLPIAVNSLIHVFMYFYYMLAALGPNYQKYIWWKKHMTTMQIVQFFVCNGYLLIAKYSTCGYSNIMTNIMITNTCVLLLLFSNFYFKSYLKKTV